MPDNTNVTLSAPEEHSKRIRDDFNRLFELAQRVMDANRRNQSGDPVDRAIAASTAKDHKALVEEMRRIAKELEDLQPVVNRLDQALGVYGKFVDKYAM